MPAGHRQQFAALDLDNGKEGVDGSSPSEGFGEMPANRHLLSSVHATRGYTAGTALVSATHRDV